MEAQITMLTAHAFGAIAAGVLGLALLVLWRANTDDHAPLHWGIASVANSLRQSGLLARDALTADQLHLFAYAADALAIVTLGGFVTGALLYLHRPVRWKCVALAGLAALLAFVLPHHFGAGTQWHATTYGVLVTLTGVVMGLAFFVAWRRDRNPGHAMLTLLMVALTGVVIATVLNVEDRATFATLTLIRVGLVLAITVTLILLIQGQLVDRIRTSQARLTGFLASSSDWVWEVDANLVITYISANIADIVLAPPTAYIGKTRDELYGANQEWLNLKSVMLARQPFRDRRIRYFNLQAGRPAVHALSGNPILSPAGQFLGYRGTGRDVTRQVETEAVLDAVAGGIAHRVGEDYMQTLVSHLARSLALDVVYIGAIDETRQRVDTLAMWRNGRITTAGAYDLATTACGDVVRNRQVICPAGASGRYPHDPLLQEERIQSYLGTPLTNSDGKSIGVIELMSRRPATSLTVAQAVANALAPRVAAELERLISDRRLRESELRFRTVLDNMPVASFLSADGRVTVANRTFAEVVGLSREQIEGLSLAELYRRVGWPEETLRASLELEDRVRRTREVQTVERRFISAAGHSRDVLSAKFPLLDASGNLVAIGTVSTDITAQKRMEASLVQSQKMEALGQLAGGIAHDFNNIVGAIVGFAGFIAEDSAPDSSTRRYAERIQTACVRARDIIRQILTFSRRPEAVRRRISVAGIFDEVAGLAAAALPAATRLDVGEVAAVAGDEAQLIQVLTNLVVNANDAIGTKGGAIRLDAAMVSGTDAAVEIAQTTDIADRPDGALRHVVGRIDPALPHVRITVRDDGEGMTRDVLARLFEPFFTTKPRGKGTGLGLPLVQGIVLSHGGAMAVTTRPGAGTTIDILLPAEPTGEAVAAAPAEAPPPPTGARILVVDDDLDFGDMVATALDRLGYETAVVNDPIEALAAFDEDPSLWDMVVTDNSMPGLTGLQVIAHIKARRPDIIAVLCSGAGQPGLETAALNAGAAAFLAKPLDPAVIAQVAARLIVKDPARRLLTAR